MKQCPYRCREIIVGASRTEYCTIPGKNLCISQDYDVSFEECSYFLFPEPLCINYDKKECITCPCDRFEKWCRCGDLIDDPTADKCENCIDLEELIADLPKFPLDKNKKSTPL